VNILLLAPHPFYRDRGSPIAVNLLLRAFSERGDHVDVVTYHEGQPVSYPNVRLFRIPNLPFVRNVVPGFSFKKIICDFFMFFKILQLLRKNNYQVVHSVEEAVFMAILLRWTTGIPYVYDMDSSLPEQLIDQIPALARIKRWLSFFEGMAIRKSEMVVPVCDSLAKIAEQHHAKRIAILTDISLLDDTAHENPIELKERLGIQGFVFMYIGNLEPYQGIDLLIESFAMAYRSNSAADLVIIGGSAVHIENYQNKCGRLHLEGCVHFMGPKPISDLGRYLSAADVIVSPRIKGTNTPMKIYSYLHSGKAVLATDLTTHTQVLDSQVALLAAPKPEEFSKGMLCLMENKALRLQLGEAGKKLIEGRYRYDSFKERLSNLYDSLESELVNGVGVR
jgi:glycosyltransferase involved in cell wall biosynthesis